ncbi:MAG: hypothetical protein WEE89_12700 [Gemmatimonadota bacterium]
MNIILTCVFVYGILAGVSWIVDEVEKSKQARRAAAAQARDLSDGVDKKPDGSTGDGSNQDTGDRTELDVAPRRYWVRDPSQYAASQGANPNAVKEAVRTGDPLAYRRDPFNLNAPPTNSRAAWTIQPVYPAFEGTCRRGQPYKLRVFSQSRGCFRPRIGHEREGRRGACGA